MRLAMILATFCKRVSRNESSSGSTSGI